MRRLSFGLAVLLAVSAPLFAQGDPSGDETLKALLSEVRGLRQQLQTSLARVESGQILLFRLQSQQQAASRASERLDAARTKLGDEQNHRKHISVDIERMEDALNSEENAVRKKALEGEIARFKADLEASAAMEQQLQAAESDCEQQLRAEQEKLAALEDQLDELVKSLASAGER